MANPSFDGVVLEDCTCAEPRQWRMGTDMLRPPDPSDVQVKDGVNAAGRWHCLVIKGVVKSAHLVEPAQAVLDEAAAEEAERAARVQARADLQTLRNNLRAKKRGGDNLSATDVRDLVELMLLAD